MRQAQAFSIFNDHQASIRYIHTHFGIGYRFAAELVDDELSVPVELQAGDSEDLARPEKDRELSSPAV